MQGLSRKFWLCLHQNSLERHARAAGPLVVDHLLGGQTASQGRLLPPSSHAPRGPTPAGPLKAFWLHAASALGIRDRVITAAYHKLIQYSRGAHGKFGAGRLEVAVLILTQPHTHGMSREKASESKVAVQD